MIRMSIEQTVKHGIIGILVVEAVRLMWRNLGSIVGFLVGGTVAILFFWPFFNDTTNNSEIELITSRRVQTTYVAVDHGVKVSITNDTRFLLTDVGVTCGEDFTSIGDVAPRSSYETVVSGKAICKFNYKASDVNPVREDQLVHSE